MRPNFSSDVNLHFLYYSEGLLKCYWSQSLENTTLHFKIFCLLEFCRIVSPALRREQDHFSINFVRSALCDTHINCHLPVEICFHLLNISGLTCLTDMSIYWLHRSVKIMGEFKRFPYGVQACAESCLTGECTAYVYFYKRPTVAHAYKPLFSTPMLSRERQRGRYSYAPVTLLHISTAGWAGAA